MNHPKPDDVLFQAGTILHYKGVPFRAGADVTLQGSQANKDSVDKEWPDGRRGTDGSTS